MVGGNAVDPQGRLVELMQMAEDQGSVTPEEIADVIDVDELPVQCDSVRSVGRF